MMCSLVSENEKFGVTMMCSFISKNERFEGHHDVFIHKQERKI